MVRIKGKLIFLNGSIEARISVTVSDF